MPSNIHFRQWDAVQTPPAELHGQFDLVHLRLVMIGIASEDLEKVVTNLALLLSEFLHKK